MPFDGRARVAHIDFETRSAANLKKCGAYAYFEHPSTDVWLARWCIWPEGEMPPRDALQPWAPGDPDPGTLLTHIYEGGRIVAHNAAFERCAWRWLRSRYNLAHWPEVPNAQWDCTLARCAALALPLGLDMATEVLGLPNKKDTAGSSLMMRMAKPRKVWSCAQCLTRGCAACTGGYVYEWNDEPEKVQRLGAYCDDDVLAECGLDNLVLPLSARERRVWELDARINDRGVRLDLPLIHRIIGVIDAATAQLNAEMKRITNGAVPKVSNAVRLVEWINAQGVPCKSVAKGEQEELLTLARFDDKPHVAYAIELRQQAKSSTAKYRAMLACVCQDGRARGLLQYHGAGTGRWAGRLIQPQNLYRVDADRDGSDIDHAIEILTTYGDPDDALAALDVCLAGIDRKTDLPLNAPMVMVAKCVRSMFVPDEGKKFVGGDSSNIEGRVIAWLCDETWKLDAFRAQDADPKNKALDLYNKSYCASFGGEPGHVSWLQRLIGKVQELALGFQGSIGAFISMAKNYGIKPSDIVLAVMSVTPADKWEAARERYHWKGVNRYDLTEEEWTALRIVVNGWRAANPKIVQGWWDIQDAAIEAVANPDTIVSVFGGRVRYLCARGFLWCSLPSTRLLAYYAPKLRETDDSYYILVDGSRVPKIELTPFEGLTILEDGGKLINRIKRQVLYDGYDGETRRWSTFAMYGGLQIENVVQATARDSLVDFMFEAELRGYPIVLTVHDELLTEVPIGQGSAAELRDIMQTVPPYLRGLPLAAKTWEGDRYNK